MKKMKVIKSAVGVFIVGLIATVFGFFGNIFAEADLINAGSGASKVMGVAVAIGAGLIFISALMFILTGAFKMLFINYKIEFVLSTSVQPKIDILKQARPKWA
jgi:hypothetical protein